MKTAFLLLFIIASSPIGWAASSCGSQSGHWTKIAREEANNLENAIKSLASKAECNFFTQTFDRITLDGIKNIEAGRQKGGKEMEAVLNNPKDLASMRNFIASNPSISSKLAKTMMASKTISAAAAPAGPVNMIKTSVSNSLNYVGRFLDAVNDPENARCLRTSGFPIQGLVISSMKMINTLGSSSYADNNKINRVTSQLMYFLDNSHINNALQTQATVEFWNELSCLIESATDSYCSIRDARQMNTQITKYKDIFKTKISKETQYNPLEAYFVLTRDIPNVSSWILDVLFGNEPMTIKEADRKNEVWDTIVNLLKDENTVTGTINEKILEMQTLYKTASDSANGKKAKIIEILGIVTRAITGQSWGESSGLNFVKSNYAVDQIPFLLIGMKDIPPPVTGIIPGGADSWEDPKCGTTYKMNNQLYKWRDFLENKGHYHCSLDHPDTLIEQISVNYRKIMAMAKIQALDYLNDFLVIDKIDLVSSLYEGVGVSIFESFLNIYNYLVKFKGKMSKLADEYKAILLDPNTSREKKVEIRLKLQEYTNMKGNVDNLLPKMERVFEAMDKEAMLALDDDIEGYEEAKKELAQAVIKVVFKEFNVLLQQSNFLKRRIETFVLYDMRLLVREEILDEYLNSWMVVSGNSLMDYMSLTFNDGFKSSYATVEEDIKNALAISNTNLSMLETFSKDYMIGAINSLNAIEEGNYGTWSFFWDMVIMNKDKEGTLARKIQNYGDLVIANKDQAEIDKAGDDLMKEMARRGASPLGGLNLWSSVKSIYYMTKHRRRYPMVFKYDADEILVEDYGNDGSLKHLRNKLCIQSLFYKKNRSLISGICQGAVISNQYIDNIYQGNDVYERKLKLSYEHQAMVPYEKHHENVCAYRDYKRNNEALILMERISSGE